MLDVFRQNYRICVTFTAILKHDHSYKIHCDVSLCKHSILMKQLNRENKKVSFKLWMMKINQRLIKLHNLLWENYQKNKLPKNYQLYTLNFRKSGSTLLTSMYQHPPLPIVSMTVLSYMMDQVQVVLFLASFAAR